MSSPQHPFRTGARPGHPRGSYGSTTVGVSVEGPKQDVARAHIGRNGHDGNGHRRVRVLVADCHPLYRESVARAIGSRAEMELVGQSADGREALGAIRELTPDVAVLDVPLPGLDGAQILNAVVRDALPTRVMFVSADLTPPTVYRAVAGGAAGYLTKHADEEQICDAISAVARGETVLSPQIHTGLVREIRLRAHEARPVLSERERQILAMIADGHSAPTIGAQLHLTTATIKTHLQHLYEKLGVCERAAAVAEAMRRGLLE